MNFVFILKKFNAKLRKITVSTQYLPCFAIHAATLHMVYMKIAQCALIFLLNAPRLTNICPKLCDRCHKTLQTPHGAIVRMCTTLNLLNKITRKILTDS